MICGGVKWGEETWEDKWGRKCLPCHRAVRARQLPARVCTDRGSWMDDREVKSLLGIGPRRMVAMMGRGELSARVVKGTGFRVFLLSENPLLCGGSGKLDLV